VSDHATNSTAEHVAATLRDQILAGEIVPGERIRQEDVAERFGTSRQPVREALRMLEAEGLTELEANKGARVPLLDMADLTLLYEMRERLEPLALVESVPRLSDATIVQLRELQQRIAADTQLTDFLALDREFHMLTYSGCTSEHLLGIVRRFWNTSQHYRRAFMSISGPQRLWVVNAEHGLLLDAIERRDSADAERYLVGHIRRTRIELSRHPEVFAREFSDS
jgi:DNA-binding GntR family transcriptional regulator